MELKKGILLFFICLMIAGSALGESLFQGLIPENAVTPIPAPFMTEAPEGETEWYEQAEFIAAFGMPEIEKTAAGLQLHFTQMDGEKLSALIAELDMERVSSIYYDAAKQKLTILLTAEASHDLSQMMEIPGESLATAAPMACFACYGTKICRDCAGKGKVPCPGNCLNGVCIACTGGRIFAGADSDGNARYIDCPECQSGVCERCRGEGRVDCPDCWEGNCPACGGKGF